MSFFNSLKPVGYGAIMYNGSTTGISSCYPFFTSQSNLSTLPSISGAGTAATINTAIADDYWLVMPGYSVTTYTSISYGGTANVYSNQTGTTPKLFKPTTANATNSFIMEFKTTTSISVPLFNGSTVTVSNYATTYDILFGSTYYHVYEFYAGSYATLSFTGSSTVSNILCLLIGGGGGGGCFTTASSTAAGGGGAGTFVTCTITAVPGSTFTVTLGNGGAGAAASTANQGTAGNPTSITRTYNSVVDNTLTAGGGGSGGAPTAGQLTGSIGSPYGSTGGACGLAADTNARPVNPAAGTAYTVTTASTVFTGITASVFSGGNSSDTAGGGGGGGAGGAGGSVVGSYFGGAGGAGKVWTVTGGRLFAGGGGGVKSNNPFAPNYSATNGAAGSGGGGSFGVPITENTGSGGGGGYATTAGGKGANGICIIAIPV